jgi:hypothetical protein
MRNQRLQLQVYVSHGAAENRLLGSVDTRGLNCLMEGVLPVDSWLTNAFIISGDRCVRSVELQSAVQKPCDRISLARSCPADLDCDRTWTSATYTIRFSQVIASLPTAK